MTTLLAIIILSVIIGWLLYATYNNYYKKDGLIEGLETATTATATTTKDVPLLSDKLDSITNTILTDCGLNVDNPDQATNLSNLKNTLSSLDKFLEATMVNTLTVGPNAKFLTNNATNSNNTANLKWNAFQLALGCVDIQNGRDSIDKVMANLPDITSTASASTSASASASTKSMFGF